MMRWQVWFVVKGPKGKVRNIEVLDFEAYVNKIYDIAKKTAGIFGFVVSREKVHELLSKWFIERIRKDKNKKR